MTVNIYFFNGNNAAIEAHYAEKEYRNDIVVEIENRFYEVYFFTKDALEYEMRKDGFFALPGIIILDEISAAKIITAVQFLSNSGFFDTFKGYDENPINNGFAHRWYSYLGKFESDELFIHTIT